MIEYKIEPSNMGFRVYRRYEKIGFRSIASFDRPGTWEEDEWNLHYDGCDYPLPTFEACKEKLVELDGFVWSQDPLKNYEKAECVFNDDLKVIKNETPVRLETWDATRKSQMAMIHDMGRDPMLGTSDEDCLYGSARTIFLSNDLSYYEQDDKRYANPLILKDGELVKLDRNGKIYRVKCMGSNGKFAYYSDILHFELIK